MNKKINPVSEGHHALTPSITVKNAAKAVEFYKKAFGAELTENFVMPDGRVGHAELRIGDSKLMLNDEFPEMGYGAPQGQTVSASVRVYIADVDAVFDRAISLGAKAVKPVSDQFWGDRQGQLRDPFGHHWSIATHVEDVSPAELKKRMEAMFAVAK